MDGQIGATGLAGLAGATGLDGQIGATGLAGRDGLTGTAGVAGVAGRDGLAGSTGLDGPTGAAGAAGLEGRIGATGLTGREGQIGATGSTGLNGLGGLAGLAGLTGPAGPAGPAPAAGAATLCVTNDAGRSRVRPGGLVHWTVVVRNCGGRAASGVSVGDRLRSGATFATRGGGRIVRRRLGWKVGLLAPGARRTYRFTTRIGRHAGRGTYVNVATAEGDNTRSASGRGSITVTSRT